MSVVTKYPPILFRTHISTISYINLPPSPINLSIYYTWRKIKSAYSNDKFIISVPIWNDEFNLSDGSYSISDIQDYFEWIIKEKHKTVADNLPTQIYINKIKNSVVFKIKTS